MKSALRDPSPQEKSRLNREPPRKRIRVSWSRKKSILYRTAEGVDVEQEMVSSDNGSSKSDKNVSYISSSHASNQSKNGI